MKKFIAILLVSVMAMSFCAIGTSAETKKEVFAAGAEWQYIQFAGDENDKHCHAGECNVNGDVREVTSCAPTGWLEGTDTETWETVATPFTHYEAWSYGATFLKKEFALDDPSSVVSFNMGIKYDEKPIVYVNGVEVWKWSEHDASRDYFDTIFVPVTFSAEGLQLKTEGNVIAVAIENHFGGAVFDMSLEAVVDDGTVAPQNVAAGKPVTVGKPGLEAYGAIATDGKVDSYIDITWNLGTAEAPEVNPECWIEIDLEKETVIDSVKVANYPWPQNYYQWEAYGANDNTKPIEEWTKLCEKKDEQLSGAAPTGYEYDVTDTNAYRYVRIVGTYHSGNIGYHFNEVEIYEAVAPETGDATVIIAAFAVVALFGTAVIVKKVND